MLQKDLNVNPEKNGDKLLSEIVELFNELLFGSGAWLGLILILSVAFLVSYKAKYSSIMFILILIFMGLNYWDEIGGKISLSSNFVWAIIIDFIGIIILSTVLYRDIKP